MCRQKCHPSQASRLDLYPVREEENGPKRNYKLPNVKCICKCTNVPRDGFVSPIHLKHIHDDVIEWKHFRATVPLCGEFAGHRWIPRKKRLVSRSFDVFFDLRLNKRLSWDAIAFIVMFQLCITTVTYDTVVMFHTIITIKCRTGVPTSSTNQLNILK